MSSPRNCFMFLAVSYLMGCSLIAWTAELPASYEKSGKKKNQEPQ